MTILLRMDLMHLVGQLLSERGLTLAVAESCTGGLVGHRVTDVPGSSAYFLGGVISYSNEAKQQLLGVAAETLVAHGAVSAETAAQMAAGARCVFGADLALSITGIAGPGGGTPEKPVGLTYVGLAHPGGVRVEHFVWKGTREENKARSAEAAFALLHRHLQQDERGEEDGDPA